jgi:hypothetical protein
MVIRSQTVIGRANHGSQPVRRTGLARIKNLPIRKALLRKARRCRPAILLSSGASQIATGGNSVLRVELRTVDPKSRAKTQALANLVDGIYRRIIDSATSERIHKIGVLPAQCSDARMPSQSLTPAVDL